MHGHAKNNLKVRLLKSFSLGSKAGLVMAISVPLLILYAVTKTVGTAS